MTNLVTVVIPIYRPQAKQLEIVSLQQTLKVLGAHRIVLMAPVDLDTRWYEGFCRNRAANLRVERFDWGSSRSGYSELLLSPDFYERFADSEYVLICQPDAFVFRDELEKWCNTGYSYIGSVIFNDSWFASWAPRGYKKWIREVADQVRNAHPLEYHANGGFSLRRVDVFRDITRRFGWYIALHKRYREWRKIDNFMEDLFIEQHFRRLSPLFSRPPKAEAIAFGTEHVDLAPPYSANDAQLPFGIHGWIDHQQDRWLPILRRLGCNC